MSRLSSASLLCALVALPLVLAAGAAQAQPYSICVDPGHGGSDPGAVGCGLRETDVNLDTALRLQALLEADPDLTPVMIRTTEVAVSLNERSSFANDRAVDRFVSIHANAFNGSASGIETYCWNSASTSSASFDQRDRIQAGMTDIWPSLPDRGGKTANFHVLRETHMPATLSELAFIDNCGADAVLLGDPSELQRAAEVHYRAIRASLGLGDGPPPVQKGFARGAVFEDLGVGTDDMTVRLAGATLEAIGDDATETTTASDVDAMWALELPAGTYRLVANHPGYYQAERTCEVVANSTAWCSIGLDPVPVQPEPDVVSPQDIVTAEDVMEDIGEDGFVAPRWDAAGSDVPHVTPPDTAHVGQPDVPLLPPQPDLNGGPGADSGGGDPGDPAGPDAGLVDGGYPNHGDVSGMPIDVKGAKGSDGCSAGAHATDGRGGAAGALLLLLAFAAGLALRRRGTARALLVLPLLFVSVACQSPAGGSGGSAPLRGERGAALTPVDHATPARDADATLRLADARALTEPLGFTQPVWAPDGDRLAVAGDRFASLHVIDLTHGETDTRRVAEGTRSGYEPVWDRDAEVLGYRAPQQVGEAVPMLAVRLDGKRAAAPRKAVPGVWVQVRDGAVWVIDGAGERVVSPAHGQHYDARLSPNGRFVSFQTLGRGLFVYDRVSATTHALGAGTHARFAGDGALVFDRSRDDGERLLETSLHIATLPEDAGETVTVATIADAPALAQFPALSPDGKTLAFEVEGAIWQGTLGR